MTHRVPHPPLLPPGFADLLPAEAETLRAARERVLHTLGGWGYRLVRPPLVETDTALFSGAGDNRPGNTFRLADPETHDMLAIRADITPQINRIAATRLGAAPRPLRLCYAGEVLKTTASGHTPSRQMIQAGAELIGAASPAAVAEVIRLAVAACQAMGVRQLSVDLCLPRLVTELITTAAIPPAARASLAAAIQYKDSGALPASLPPRVRALCEELFQCVGPLDTMLSRLGRLPLWDDRQRDLVGALVAVAEIVLTPGFLAPPGDVTLTLDLGERQGFSFQTGVCFALFAPGLRGEIGRGGAYRIDPGGEPAAGFSIYLDPLLRILPDTAPPRLVLVPFGCDAALLQAKGYTLVQSLDPAGPGRLEAETLGCIGWWDGSCVQML